MVLIGLVIAVSGCQPPSTSATPAGTKVASSTAAAPTPAAKPAWETRWNELLESGKKEGKVVVYTTNGAETVAALLDNMKKKYGIDVEVVTGNGSQLSNKITTERRAGLFAADIYQGGVTTMLTTWKPAGFLDPLEPALILPEVVDNKLWLDKTMPFIDKDKMAIAFSAGVSIYVAVNTDLVQKDEIQSYFDLLNPKWKGNIVLYDPTLGAGNSAALFRRLMLPDLLGREKAIEFMRNLVKQEPIITRDLRQQMEWIARAKYPLALAPQREQVAEFQRAGAPVRPITYFRESVDVSPGSGGLALINNAPHPNAAKVFINWLLSKDGQYIYAKSYAAPSARVDIPPDGVDPAVVPDPNKRYVHLGEETYVTDPETVKLISDIFSPLLK